MGQYSAGFSIQYGSFTVGGSTARRIVDYTIEEHGYEVAAIEFEFITNAASESAFITEINACRDAFRDPRNDITLTNGSETREYNHSDNTALDTDPTIIKDGDPADAGFSRHFRVRIDFGLPADNVGTNFRRYSTVSVEYTASRQRIVTVDATYTAKSTDPINGAFTQYRNEISAYLLTVVNAIDSTATWETIAEPDVERNETDKVVHATIVAKEILFNQAVGLLNDDDLNDAKLEIEVEDLAPGDSTTGGIVVSNVGVVGQEGAGAGQERPTVVNVIRGGEPGVTVTQVRPQFLRLTYDVNVDASRTKALKQKWATTIRRHMLAQAKVCAVAAPVLIRETPLYEFEPNRLRATMELIAYRGEVFEKRISIEQTVQTGVILKPTTSKNRYKYYKYPGPAIRTARAVSTFKRTTNEADPNAIIQPLIAKVDASITNLLSAPESGGEWTLISHRPLSANLLQGLPGAKTQFIAEVEIETIAQYFVKVRPSVASAGGVTGAGLTP